MERNYLTRRTLCVGDCTRLNNKCPRTVDIVGRANALQNKRGISESSGRSSISTSLTGQVGRSLQ